MKFPMHRHQKAPSFITSFAGAASIITTAEEVCSRNASIMRGLYPTRSAIRLHAMIVKPNPVNPNPVMTPRSPLVKWNCVPQTSRIVLRMPNSVPAAISVKKLARNSCRLLFIEVRSLPRLLWKPGRHGKGFAALHAVRSVEIAIQPSLKMAKPDHPTRPRRRFPPYPLRPVLKLLW